MDREYEQISKIRNLIEDFENGYKLSLKIIDGLERKVYNFDIKSNNENEHLEWKIKEERKNNGILSSIINSMDISIVDDYAQKDVLNKLLLNAINKGCEYSTTNSLSGQSKKIKKIYYKNLKSSDKEIEKKDATLYRKLNKNRKLKIIDGLIEEPFLRSISETIEKKFKQSKLDMSKLLKTYRKCESRYYLSLPTISGINKKDLNAIIGVLNEEIREENICLGTMDTYRLYKKIKEFNSYEYHIKESSKLRKLETKYEDVLKRAREIWFLEQLDKMFKKTIIGNSEICKEIIKISNSLSTKLKKDIKKLDKEYEKLNMDRVIKDADTYRKMARELDDLDKRIAGKIKSDDILEAEQLKKKYEELLNKITIISKENPGLYKPIFDPERIIIDDIKKRIEIEEKRKINNDKINAKTVIKNDSNNLSEKSNEPKKANKDNYNDFELDIDLQTIRSSYYQKYLTEKIQKGNLINIPFSKYLEKIAVDQVELIEIEKKREKMAHNIYQQYLKYYAALENKKEANSFEDFAYYKYNIDDIDVPIENEEEYKGMKL